MLWSSGSVCGGGEVMVGRSTSQRRGYGGGIRGCRAKLASVALTCGHEEMNAELITAARWSGKTSDGIYRDEL